MGVAEAGVSTAQPPIVVSYGGGTNSTAVLVLMKQRGERPALIMFADTGDEKPETYRHIELMQGWCRDNGFPQIERIKNDLPQGVVDGSLYNQCIRLGTMPSKAFGLSSCSMKWKVEPQYKFLRRWMATFDVQFVRHFVGFDADERHRADKPTLPREFERAEFPLIEADWGREECVAAIDAEGLPRPGKSSCWHCPSSKKAEVLWLKETHPDLYAKAIFMESVAIAGVGQAPEARVAGLGRHWNWRTFAGDDIATPEPCGACAL